MTVEVIQPRTNKGVQRLENSKRRAELDQEVVLALLKNPVFQIIAGYVIIEFLQKQKLIPETAGTFAEGGVLTGVFLQQISPVIPDILKAGTEGFNNFIKLIPAIAGMAAKGG